MKSNRSRTSKSKKPQTSRPAPVAKPRDGPVSKVKVVAEVKTSPDGKGNRAARSQPRDPELEQLLEYLVAARGFDFTAYKRSSLARLIHKRLGLLHVESYEKYVDYLEVHPEELPLLFDAILINLTGFFRDSQSWEFLANNIIPKILEGGDPRRPVRVWSAGCASGEEACTLAMLFAHAMGKEQLLDRVKVFATDVDEHALGQARQGLYTVERTRDVPAPLRERYFSQGNGGHVFDKDLRRAIIYGHHDLLQDAPISHLDLIVCRNTLIYFNAEVQAKVLDRFAFALNIGGYLFLGKAEMLLAGSPHFDGVELKSRIFRRVAPNVSAGRLAQGQEVVPEPEDHRSAAAHLHEAAIESDPTPEILVNPAGLLAFANKRARALFNLVPADTGRPLQDLEVAYQPVELQPLIDRTLAEGRPVHVKNVDLQTALSKSRRFDVSVIPLATIDGGSLGSKVLYTESTQYRELQEELEHTKQELETTNEELQSANEELQTTNEELQSTNEELETTNEELQTTNEELETMNEELQSANAELEAVNTHLEGLNQDLNEMNGFNTSLLGSINTGVIGLDRELRITAWNLRSTDLWGLQTEEVVGKNLFSLNIGLPTEQLKQPVRHCLSGESQLEKLDLAAQNRRGKPIELRVMCTPLGERTKQPQGVILLMEETQVKANSG